MEIRIKICAAMILVSALLLIFPASGGIYTVTEGGTVFIGEQRLDISLTGVIPNQRIGWFGPGSNGTTGNPAATVFVGDVKNFYVDPAVFSGKTGMWYTLPDKRAAFVVEDPSLSVRVFDETLNIDVTNADRGIPRGDLAGFRFETNLVAMLNRSGISQVPVTVHVIIPDGSTLSGVSAFPLKDIGVNSSPYSTGPVWNTGDYHPGVYTVWAECNVNNMKNNYAVEGKTETPHMTTVKILEPALINTPLVTRTIPVTTPAMQSRPLQPATDAATSPTPASPGPGIVLVLAGAVGAALIVRRQVLK